MMWENKPQQDAVYSRTRVMCAVQGDGIRRWHSVSSTAAAECREFNTKHVQLGRSPAELHGNIAFVFRH